jgi:hypothetical protein
MIWSYKLFQIPFSRSLNTHNTHHSNIHFDFSIDRERMHNIYYCIFYIQRQEGKCR